MYLHSLLDVVVVVVRNLMIHVFLVVSFSTDRGEKTQTGSPQLEADGDFQVQL